MAPIIIPWEHPTDLVPKLVNQFGPFVNILDVGGAGGTVGKPYWTSPIHVIDIYPPETNPGNFTLGNALDIEHIYGPKSFDLVLACDIIEHLTKEDGFKLLEKLNNVARKAIVVATPNGFSRQDPEDFPNEKWAQNPYQKHISGWHVEELEAAGYKVYLNGDTPPEAAGIIAVKNF